MSYCLREKGSLTDSILHTVNISITKHQAGFHLDQKRNNIMGKFTGMEQIECLSTTNVGGCPPYMKPCHVSRLVFKTSHRLTIGDSLYENTQPRAKL